MNSRKPFTGSLTRIVPTKGLPSAIGEMFCGREGILWVSQHWVDKLVEKPRCQARPQRDKRN